MSHPAHWQHGAAEPGRHPAGVRRVQPAPLPFRSFGTKPKFFERLAFFLLGVLVFSIPWEDWWVIPGVGTMSRLIGIIAMSAAVLALAEKGRVRILTRDTSLMVLFVLWSAIGLIWTIEPKATQIAAASNAELLIMAGLIWQLCEGEREILFLLQAFVLGCYVSALDTIFEYLRGRQAVFGRFAGSGFNPNDLAILMALSIPMAHYLSLKIPGIRAWINRIEIVLAITTIFLAGSRGALIALIVALAIVPLTYSALATRERFGIAVAGILALCISLFFIPPTSWHRLASASAEIQQGTLNDRTVIWKAGFSVFENHPITGVGAGAFPYGVEPIMGQPLSAHNTFLSVLVEEGLVGFGLFWAILAVFVWSSLYLARLERYLWLILFGSWAVGVNSAAWESRKPTWLLFGLCAAQLACRWPAQHRVQAIRSSLESVSV